METHYAPAGRASEDDIFQLFKTVNNIPLVRELIDKTTEVMLILNKERQIVFTNKAFLDLIGANDINDVLGIRPGEALSCVHSEDVSGCGTTEFCIQCGAVNVILASQESHCEAHDECLLSMKGGSSVELSVVARPFNYAGHEFTFFSANDISEVKRKQVLEKIFFHDILNLAGGIYSVIDLFKEDALSDLPAEMLHLLHQSSSDMVKEINAYRTLLMAERDEFKAMPRHILTGELVEEVAALYSGSGGRSGIAVKIADDSCNMDIRTDPSLLKRILINMMKNAIEASFKGDVVTIACKKTEDGAVFQVHNPAVMADKVKMNIFKRTFTTKSTGSGLGTYSIKLLGEKYLKGKVSFYSGESEGTTFEVLLPEDIN